MLKKKEKVLDEKEFWHIVSMFEWKYLGNDENTYFRPDDFLYSRCVAVANGRDYYYKILKNPIEMIKNMEFESLLYIPEEAYEMKNNEEFYYVPKYDFETFSNVDKWKAE